MTALEQFFNGIQPCPSCGSAIAREHFGHEPAGRDGRLAYLFCEHCNLARIVVLVFVGGHYEIDFWQDIPPDNAVERARFHEHLEAARRLVA